MHVKLLKEVRICLRNVICAIAVLAEGQIARLDTENCMRRAFRSAAHLVQVVVDLPSRVFVSSGAKTSQIVRINMLSVQESKNALESLLGAPHITLEIVLPTNVVKIQFG